MVDADDDLSAAVDALERAATLADAAVDAGTTVDAGYAGASTSAATTAAAAAAAAASGNLANALLARGRLQRRLAAAAQAEESRAATLGVRAGVEGAAAFHTEIAEEFLVLAGRRFRQALMAAAVVDSINSNISTADGDGDGASGGDRGGGSAGGGSGAGVTRALTGWGAALALRGRMVREAGAGAAEAAALAAAASEKYRAALESPHASSAAFPVTSRAAVFMDWGDALRLAGESSADAAAASGVSGGDGVAPDECWGRALQCYREVGRRDAQAIAG
jgi:hypothetical protein